MLNVHSVFSKCILRLCSLRKINHVQSTILAFAYNSGLLYFGYFVVPDDFKVILFTWSQNFSGTGSTNASKTSFEMPRDFTIFFLPNRANFRLFQLFNVFSKVSNLSRVFQSILICHLFFCSLKSKRTSYIQSKHCTPEWAFFTCLSYNPTSLRWIQWNLELTKC